MSEDCTRHLQEIERLHAQLQENSEIMYKLRKIITKKNGELKYERRKVQSLLKEKRQTEKAHYRNGQKRGKGKNGGRNG